MTETIRARRIIQTLRSGTVNAASARAISVGTEEIESKFLTKIESLANGGAEDQIVIVEDDYGFGKSHLRSLVSGSLVQSNIPFLFDCIDARASSLAHIHRAMPSWLGRIRIGPHLGLRDILYHEVLPRDGVIEWLSGKYDPFAWGLKSALRGEEFGWMQALGLLYQYPDYSYQHEKAISLLFSCTDLLHNVGKGGLVVMLDEAENIGNQYDIRGRRRSYDLLRRLTRHPFILPVLFVTKRFYNMTDWDRTMGKIGIWSNWTHAAKQFIEHLETIEALRPPKLNSHTAMLLVQKVGSLFSDAYGLTANGVSTNSILNSWQSTPTRSVRLLVRMAVNEFDLLRQELR